MQMLLSLLGLTAAVSGLSLQPRADSYSACFADRGYTKDDALKAGQFVWQNATFANGTFMAKNDCIYKLVDSTMVSVCNGAARNRTVNQGEVRRGIQQLTKDCGAGGTFNGVHVVNNLTFSAFGVYGGRNIAIPNGAPPPDLPGTAGRKSTAPTALTSRQAADPCFNLGYTGTPRTDCARNYYLAPDGSCDGALTPQNECQVFCEVKRTGFLGIESPAPGEWGVQKAAGQEFQLAEGVETTVSHGFSIGIEGIADEVIGAGVSYEYSISETKTKSSAMTNDPSPTYLGRWVVFPMFVESCGSVTRSTYSEGFTPSCGIMCGPSISNPTCTGPRETIGNVCSYVPYVIGGKAQSFWTWRYETLDGNPVPIDQQSQSYKSICTTPDPDGDGVNECLTAPVGARLFKKM